MKWVVLVCFVIIGEELMMEEMNYV